jgi:threonine dehydrogenase-like Zn-dependent dehydrogenase
MLAAIAERGGYHFRLARVDVPTIAAGEALVRVRAASVTRGLLAMWHFTDHVRLLPATLGHEIAGVVEEVGDGVESFEPGDRVRVHPTVTCGLCRPCLAGESWLCPRQFTIGYASTRPLLDDEYRRYHNGGLAECVRVPARNLDPISPAVGYALAAKAGTLANSLRAVRAALGGGSPAALVVTAASGGSGAAASRCARMLGHGPVLGLGTRMEPLKRLVGPAGLTHAVATDTLDRGWREQDLVTAAIREALRGEGPDGVVDFMPFGRDLTVQAIRSMRPGGRAVLAGGNVSELDLSYLELMRNQYEIRGLRGNRREDEREVLSALATGRLSGTGLVTHDFPLADVNRAMDAVMSRSQGSVFVVVRP